MQGVQTSAQFAAVAMCQGPSRCSHGTQAVRAAAGAPENEFAAVAAREQVVVQRRASAADVQRAGW